MDYNGRTLYARLVPAWENAYKKWAQGHINIKENKIYT